MPYGVKIHINSSIEEQNQMPLYDVNLESETIGVRNKKWAFRAIPIIDYEDETEVIRPYLRPMSSMTEEEESYVHNGHIEFWVREDYCNKHHLDYRGLIEKGLALEASKDMYKTE